MKPKDDRSGDGGFVWKEGICFSFFVVILLLSILCCLRYCICCYCVIGVVVVSVESVLFS